MSFVDRYIIIPDGSIRECLSLTGHPSTHLFTHPSIHPFLPHKCFKRTSLTFKDIVSVQQRQCLGRLAEIKCKALKKKKEWRDKHHQGIQYILMISKHHLFLIHSSSVWIQRQSFHAPGPQTSASTRTEGVILTYMGNIVPPVCARTTLKSSAWLEMPPGKTSRMHSDQMHQSHQLTDSSWHRGPASPLSAPSVCLSASSEI